MTADSESSTVSIRPPLPGARWALALGGVLLAGLLIIVVCGSMDRGRRGQLETVAQVTAVEDKTYYSISPDGAQRPAAGVRLGDRWLFPVSPDIVGLRDSEAHRVATDPTTGITVYTTEDPKALSEKERANTYLLKVETGKYVKARPVARRTEE